ncbi:MAG: CBS domain-containing protein [Nitrososphaeraceae archaeon]|nr:CBS domain-containing protein [Nitrososphaeraceae archaeon]
MEHEEIITVTNIMTPLPLQVVNRVNSVTNVSLIMKEYKIGSVVVIDTENRPIGIVTERDIVRRVICERKNPLTTQVESVMSKPVITAEHTTKIDKAINIMIQNKIRRLPIVKTGILHGIITSTDLVKFSFKKEKDQYKILKCLSRYHKYWEE